MQHSFDLEVLELQAEEVWGFFEIAFPPKRTVLKNMFCHIGSGNKLFLLTNKKQWKYFRFLSKLVGIEPRVKRDYWIAIVSAWKWLDKLAKGICRKGNCSSFVHYYYCHSLNVLYSSHQFIFFTLLLICVHTCSLITIQLSYNSNRRYPPSPKGSSYIPSFRQRRKHSHFVESCYSSLHNGHR